LLGDLLRVIGAITTRLGNDRAFSVKGFNKCLTFIMSLLFEPLLRVIQKSDLVRGSRFYFYIENLVLPSVAGSKMDPDSLLFGENLAQHVLENAAVYIIINIDICIQTGNDFKFNLAAVFLHGPYR